MTRQQKAILRQKMYLALDQNDTDTAKRYMNELCINDPVNKQRGWSEDETEFLMHHVKALGYENGIATVAKKLGRTKLGVKKKYSSIKKKTAQQVG